MNAAGDLPTIENEILTVIEPQDAWLRFHFTELWRYRELLFFLVWKEIKVRYKQTLLGASWAILQPLLTMVIFSVVFGLLAKLPSEGTPYPVFSLVGLLCPGNYSPAPSVGPEAHSGDYPQAIQLAERSLDCWQMKGVNGTGSMGTYLYVQLMFHC